MAPKLLDVALVAAESCGIPKSNIFLLNFYQEQIPEDHQSWSTLLDHGEQDWVSVVNPDDTTAAYFSTSGTSGLPKAAVIPHSYLVSQGEMQVFKSAVSYEVSDCRSFCSVNADKPIDFDSYRPSSISCLHIPPSAPHASENRDNMLRYATIRSREILGYVTKLPHYSDRDSSTYYGWVI